jgi:hypothetical protein
LVGKGNKLLLKYAYSILKFLTLTPLLPLWTKGGEGGVIRGKNGAIKKNIKEVKNFKTIKIK